MTYDYTFSGLGLSTILVLNEMFENNLLEGKRILIIEPNELAKDEKTWCYWEGDIGKFDNYINAKWNSALFKNENNSINCLNEGLVYKQISSTQFIENLFNKLVLNVSLTLKKETFVSFKSNDFEVEIVTDKNSYNSEYFFSSVLVNSNYKSSLKYPLLNQHFIGWFVETKYPFFDPDKATFMDFSVNQKQNTRFMYVLPFSKNKALIEYTLFSKDLLAEEEYEHEIELYMSKMGITDYSILKKEQGNIPMTVFPFWKNNEKRVLFIGTAGGWTKASTGYTFQNSVKKAEEVVSFLKKGNEDFKNFHKWNNFTFYDSLFVDVLYTNNSLGKEIFSSMFTKVNPNLILKFLDEKTNLYEDFKIILACPKLPFLKALFKKIIK